MSERQEQKTERRRTEPSTEADTIRMYGVGPRCPGCGGPTHAVTAEECERPWWCQSCNVRLDDCGEYGSNASFPSGSKPSNNE